jgi:hypothetical protein
LSAIACLQKWAAYNYRMKSRSLLLAVVFSCPAGYAGVPGAHTDGTYTRTANALGDSGTISIQFRSLGVEITSNSGKPRKYIVRMLYDPRTKLVYGEAFEMYPGYDPEGDANLALQNAVIYLTDDRMTVFRLTMSQLSVSESGERENTIDEAQGKRYTRA